MGLPYRAHHPTLRTHHRQRQPERGSLGTGNDATARPQAPETTWSAPGAPTEGQAPARSARPGGEQRGIGTAPPNATGRAAHRTRGRGRPARMSAASGDPRPTGAATRRDRRRAGSGRSPQPSPPPPPFPTPPRAEDRRGARGPRAEREERSHSPGVPVPRLTRLRPGPGEREITTSIGKTCPRRSRGGKAWRGQPTRQGLLSASPAPFEPQGREQPGNPRRTPDTRHGALRKRGRHGHGRMPTQHGGARGKGPTPPAHAALGCWRPEAAPQPGPHLEAREPAHRPTRTARVSEGRAGPGDRSPARSPARPQRPTSLRRQSPEHSVSAPTWQQKVLLSGQKSTVPPRRGLATGLRDLLGPCPGHWPQASLHHRERERERERAPPPPEPPGPSGRPPGAWWQPRPIEDPREVQRAGVGPPLLRRSSPGPDFRKTRGPRRHLRTLSRLPPLPTPRPSRTAPGRSPTTGCGRGRGRGRGRIRMRGGIGGCSGADGKAVGEKARRWGGARGKARRPEAGCGETVGFGRRSRGGWD